MEPLLSYLLSCAELNEITLWHLCSRCEAAASCRVSVLQAAEDVTICWKQTAGLNNAPAVSIRQRGEKRQTINKSRLPLQKHKPDPSDSWRYLLPRWNDDYWERDLLCLRWCETPEEEFEVASVRLKLRRDEKSLENPNSDRSKYDGPPPRMLPSRTRTDQNQVFTQFCLASN